MSKKISRRDFLRMSAMGAASVALASCGPTATAAVAPTKAPEVKKEEPTAIPTQAAAATAVPTVAASKESPALAELVKAGKLPPLSERLPKNPLTLSPVNAIGKYGGRLRISNSWFAGCMEESMYGHSALRWIDDGLGIAPGMCEFLGNQRRQHCLDAALPRRPEMV